MSFSKRGFALAVIVPVGFAAAWIASQSRVESIGRPVATQALMSTVAAPTATPVNGSQPLLPPRQVTLDLSGEVTGLAQGDANPVVTVSVGQRTFSAQVQNGGYQVRITGAWPNEMVRVDARATRVHYASIAGTVSRLKSLSGGDGNVTLSEDPALRVSPWSTALSWMVRLTLEGKDATTDAEFDRATRAVVGKDIVMAAYVMDAMARGAMSLPSGCQDGYQLLQDEAKYENVLATEGLAALAQSYMFDQAAIAPIRSLSDVPDQLALISAVTYREVALHAEDFLLLNRNADSTYSLFEDESLADPQYSAVLTGDGGVQLQPLNGSVRYYHDPWGALAERTSRGHLLRRIEIGAHYSIWAVRSDWRDLHVLDPDHDAPYEQFVTEYRLFSGFDLAHATHDGWPLLTYSGRAMPWMCQGDPDGIGHAQLSNCDYVVHQFDASGQGHTVEHGSKVTPAMQPGTSNGTKAFDWSLDQQGALRITTTEAVTRFWPLAKSVLAPVIYLSTATNGDGATQSIAGVSAAILDFREGISAPGTWRSGLEKSTPTTYPRTVFGVDVVRGTDGYGQDVNYGTSEETYPVQWKSTDAGVFDTRSVAMFDGAPSHYVRRCSEAFADGATACAPVRVRLFRELLTASSADGETTSYGIEEFYEQSTLSPPGATPQYDITRFSRPNFFYCHAGACLSAPGAAAAIAAPLPATRALAPTRSRQTWYHSWLDFLRPMPIFTPLLRDSTNHAMPIYAFECTTCGHSYDRLQKLSDPDPDTCPHCGAHTVKRQLTAPSFRLSGSGWYETDFKKDGDKKRNLVEGGEGAGKAAATSAADASKPAEKPATPAAKTEAKPAAKPAAGDA